MTVAEGEAGAGVGSASAVPLLEPHDNTHCASHSETSLPPRDSSLPGLSWGLHQLLHEDILVLILSEETAQSALTAPHDQAGDLGPVAPAEATQAAGSSEPERLSGLLLGSCCWPLGSSPTQHWLQPQESN